MQHLAVFKKNVLDLIFRGEKIMESRFSLSKIPPYATIYEGDEIFLKESGGKVFGKMRAGEIRSYYNLTPEKIKKIEKEFNDRIKGNFPYWREKEKSHYGTLIEILSPQKFRVPFGIKKHDRRPWITLKEEEIPLDRSQLAIRFGSSDSLGALKGLVEKYFALRKVKEEKKPLFEIIRGVAALSETNSILEGKIIKKEKEEIEKSLAQILTAVLALSSKLDVDLHEATLKEIAKKEKYSLDKLKEL